MMLDSTPDWINKVLKENGGYNSGCLVSPSKAASLFALEYATERSRATFYPTIAEVKLSGHQHFIVMIDPQTQIDPWYGTKGALKYSIISYRNLRPKQGNPPTGGNMKAEVYENNGVIWLYFHGIRYAYKSWDEYIADGWKAGNQTKVDVLPPALDPETMSKEMTLLKETNKNLQTQTDDTFNQVLSIKKELDILQESYNNLAENYKKLKNKQCPKWYEPVVEWLKDIISKFRKE
jgi:hypothetical protein